VCLFSFQQKSDKDFPVNLSQMGWSAYFADRHTSPYEPARVAVASREQFVVWTESAGECAAVLSGRFRHQSDIWPATGDWVALREHTVIEAVLPRRTKISRKEPGRGFDEQVLTANVDKLFIVTGLDHDYNPRRLERYLLLAAESGAEPVILLNKADLHADVSRFVNETQSLSPGTTVHAVSATEGWGMTAIAATLASGETGALIGSSGAGKSTIVNALLGEVRQKTTAVRESDQRGRHTTTHRELLAMPGGWLLIDMPGLRELQLWVDPERLGDAFAEVEELAQQCKFRDCRHQGEPGCALAGLDEDRVKSYNKLTRELEHFERQRDIHATIAQKKKWKVIHKAMRNVDKRA
jgi:ribosome biogenesis GTPase